MNGSELQQFQHLQVAISRAYALFQQVVGLHQSSVNARVKHHLKDKKDIHTLCVKTFTHCRNRIVARHVPPEFETWAQRVADDLCALCAYPQGKRQLRAIRPEILPQVQLPVRNTPSEGDERATLRDFSSGIEAIKSLFWSIVDAPHTLSRNPPPDKRALLLRYALKRGLSHSDAEDIAQSTLLKALTRLYQYQPQPQKQFMNWLYTLAWSAVVDGYREWKSEPARADLERHPDRAPSPRRQAYEQICAALAVMHLARSAAESPQRVPQVLICFFHQVMGHKPKTIAADLGDFSLQELLSALRAMCLRLDAFDGNEALVDDVIEPLQRQLDQDGGADGPLGDLPLSHFWAGQRRSDYYIQNVSRRAWKRVAEQVKAELLLTEVGLSSVMEVDG